MSEGGLENFFSAQYRQCHKTRKVRCEGNVNTEFGNRKHMQTFGEKVSKSEVKWKAQA